MIILFILKGEKTMSDSVQWIRLKVGMFDGNSFKKIKRATIGGVNYRDKLTAIWFELLDLAGKGNANGCLVDNNEIPFETYEDIAIMLDRDTEEIELCMQFYLKEKMVELIGKVYCLTNFMQYQNKDGLEKIREQKRLAQARWREKRKAQGLIETNVDTCVDTTSILHSNSNSISNNINIVTNEEINNYFDKIYSIYPRKVGKVQAKETFEHKLRGLEKEEAYKKAIAIYRMLENQIQVWQAENDGQGRKVEFIPYCSSWLNPNVEDSPHFKKGRKR
jgi:predicted phage replisome organizer